MAKLITLFLILTLIATGSFAAFSHSEDCPEPRKGLVILVEFPDVRPAIDKQFVRNRFNQLDQYVRQMSYGRVCIDMDLTDWQKLPGPISKYSISAANLRVDKSRVTRLIQDSIDAAEISYDLSRYSFVVLFLGAAFKEYGMVGLCGYPGMLGWKNDDVLQTRSGKKIPGGVAIFTYSAHIGTLFHDIAHIWGGVKDGKRVIPCLYDHDIQAVHATRDSGFEKALVNMGYWDPLSCHLYEPNISPPGISSWTRARLDWIPQDKLRIIVSGTTEIILDPLEDRESRVVAIKIPIGPTRFYLVENRHPTGAGSASIPGKGILIMYADDTIDECRHGRSPVKLVNANPSIPALKGAAFTLQGNSEFVDKTNGITIKLIERIGNSYKLQINKLPSKN